jgi:hypothetical protein
VVLNLGTDACNTNTVLLVTHLQFLIFALGYFTFYGPAFSKPGNAFEHNLSDLPTWSS